MDHNSRRRFLKVASASALLGFQTVNCSAIGSKTAQYHLDEQETFFAACEKGDLETVRRLVVANEKFLEARNPGQQSGFAVALLNDNKPVAEFLRNAGYKSDLHETALAGDWKLLDEQFGARTDEIAALANADHPVGGTAMFAAVAGGAGSDT